jgi:hypothetical protein
MVSENIAGSENFRPQFGTETENFNRDNAAVPLVFSGHRQVMDNCVTFQCTRHYFLVVWYIPVDDEVSFHETERICNLNY